MPLASGTAFAGFVVDSRLGSGETGEVYLAHKPGLAGGVALKILPGEVSADDEFRQRFQRDAAIAVTLSHPNIVAVREHGEFDGRLWISSDYVEGIDAQRLLADAHPQGVPVDRVTSIVDAVASALDYAHDRGLN